MSLFPVVTARRLLAAGLWCFLLTLPALAQDPGTRPPIIDRDIFFGDPEITGAQLSPDGTFMSFIKPYNGVRNIWVKDTTAPFESARPVTADTTRPIPGYTWSRDGRFILYVQDKGGDENYHVYALNPADPLTEGQAVPPSRDLTPLDGVRAMLYHAPRSAPADLFVGLNDRDPSWHDLYRIDIATGARTLVRENTDQIAGWTFDLKDQLRLASRTAPDGSTEILRVTPDSFEVVYTCSVEESCTVRRFHKDGQQVYMSTNKGADVDLARLILFNPETGAETLVESDPDNRVDFSGALFSEVTDELIATIYNGDRQRIYWKNDGFARDYDFLKSKLGDVDIDLGSSTDDERLWIINANSDMDPGAVYLFDRVANTLTFQFRPRPDLPVEYLAPMTPVRYTAPDGLEIPAYLTLPKGVAPTNLPAIIFPHGGPWARDSWGYSSFAQFLANRGYAVLQPNFRSSTGYGKAFLNAGNKQWGEAMQDDLTAGAQYLIEAGIADPDRVGIMGGSYGGYATLAGLTFTPDVYAAGVSIVGPSNLMTLLESIPPYWASIRKIFYERMGDPNTPEGQAQLKRQSPLFSANEIKAPLLVIQGANDPRVKQAESDQIVVAMRELGRPVEYLVAPDEGHGFARPINNLAMMARIERFLAKHLGGRYQADMNPETITRLRELTVDITTVEMPEAMDPDMAAVALPALEGDLTAGTYAYAVTVSMGGQTMPMDVHRTVEAEADTWVIRDVVKTPMGDALDTSTLKQGSLLPVARALSQGPMQMTMTHGEEAVEGVTTMNGQETPFTVQTPNPVFSDGGSLTLTLAQLPLAEGYTTVYRVVDSQKQSVRVFGLEVVGMETVTVPAGTFETYKVELTPKDGDADTRTMWVSTDESRQVVKTTASMPQMNGATITSELSSFTPTKDGTE